MAALHCRIYCALLEILLFFVCVSQTQVLLRKNDLSVKIGRSVYFLPEDLTFDDIKSVEKCRLEVVQNDPITQRVGRVEPQVFDCNFQRNSVKYIHSGFPLLQEDLVKFRVHKFTDRNTITETFYVSINIVNITYDVIRREQSLKVSDYYGVSNPIDSSVIRLRYNANNNVSCTVAFSKYKSHWPLAGQIVMGKKNRVVDAVKKDCREFLFMELRYEHLKPPLPNIDYLPLTVSLYDPSVSNELIVEQYFLPIHIQGAFPNSPPRASFMSMYIMDVDQFVLSTIIPGVISAEDQETPVQNLIFNISKPLGRGQGYLVNLDDPTAPITSFLQDDLESHRIGFQPPNVSFSERKVYEVGFTVFDSHFEHSSPIMLHIAVRPSATRAPRVSLNKGLVLLEGQSRAITSNHLQIVDKDNVRNVKIFIKGGLKHGRLEVNGRATIYFTPTDIQAGRVMYHHDDTDTTRDQVELRITDGSNTVRATFPINIIPKDDSPPYLVSNLGLELNEGETVPIHPDILKAHDSDSLDDNIIYTIARPPQNGELLQRRRPSDRGNLITEFGQQELLRGQVYYKHYGNEIFNDDFEFTIQDKHEPPNVSNKQRFQIHVNPVNDNPPQIASDATRLIYVKETEVAFISKNELRYTDIETNDKDLLYSISSPPYFVYSSGREDAGRLVATHNVDMLRKDYNIPPVISFKQNDIDHKKIAYIPPQADIGAEPRLVRFVYTVQDSSGNKVLGQHFDIEVQPVNNERPKFVTSKLLVEEGGVLSISTNQLSAVDHDTPLEELTFSCESVPRFGTLQKRGMTMRAGDVFTIKDLRKQSIRYLHDGSEVVLDTFILNIFDGIHKVSKVITIDIVPVDDQAPQLYDNLHAHLIVSEGGEAVITKSILAAKDEDTDDELLTFLVIKQPRHGILKVRGETVSKFTQQNVKDRVVKFRHTSGEIGPSPHHDSITFIVSDQVYPTPADLPVYDLNITITPVDNQKPVILSGNPIFVNEGEKYRFDPDVLGARDLDTPPYILEFIITKQPQWGYLENTKPSPGSERSNAGIRVNSFKVQDIIDGSINYVQANHIGVEPLYDSVELYATDGKLNSPLSTIALTIVPQNDELPDVMLQDFILAEGGKITIDQSMIDALDLDLPKDPITFAISRSPRHGELMMVLHTENGELNVPAKDFTIEELHSGLSLLYQHDGSETLYDKFSIKVSDGRHQVQKTCNITITPINDEKPEVSKNTGLRINYGESGMISSRTLQAEDKDDNDKHIYFIITKLPNKGLLQRKTDKERAGDDTRWEEMRINENFTQFDVNKNKVRYVHTGRLQNDETDQFSFVLSDGLNKRQIEQFQVEIQNSRKSPNIAVLNKGLVVNEGERKVISTGNLSASDETTKADEIVFAITKSPRFGQLEYISRPFVAISSFTQLDLAGQLIVYHHLSKSDITHDMFNFTVTNGFSESKDGIFHLTIKPHDKIHPSLVINRPLTVLQGSEEAVTPMQLQITDPDTPIQNLTYIITKPPSYGHLYNRGVLITQSFTQYDLDRGYISYESYSSHSGRDHFLFLVSDGKHQGFLMNETIESQAVEFEIKVTPLQNDAPKLVVNKSPDNLEYLGRGRYGFILSNKNLRAVDSDTDASQLMYILIERPQHGHLENVVSKRFVRRRFTQRDLDEVALWYVVDDNDGATNDSFAFRVEDIRGNLLDRKKFVLKWSRVEFIRTEFVVCENMGSLSLTISRIGSLEESAFVGIRVRGLSAKVGEDFTTSSARQVQFSPGVSKATWSVTFKEDEIEENNERLKLMLEQPVNTIIGEKERARIQIIDADPRTGECPQYIGMLSKNQPVDLGPLDYPLPAIEDNSQTILRHKLAGPLPLEPHEKTLLPEVIKGPQQDESPSNRVEQTPPKKPTKKKRKRKDKKKNKKRRRKMKTKFRREKRVNSISRSTDIPPVPKAMTQAKPKPPPPAPKSHLIQAPQQCDSTTKGLLHFDVEHQQMFKCDGKMWNAWKPQQSQDDEQPTSHNCEPGWSEFDGRCYIYVNDKVSWNEAERVCRVNQGAELVSVLSEVHHLWLADLTGRNAFWIGLNDKRLTNKWEYLNGDPIAYTSWKNGTPRVAPRKKHKKNCVMVNRRRKWKNKKCDGPKAKILCEKQATQTSSPSKGFFFGF